MSINEFLARLYAQAPPSRKRRLQRAGKRQRSEECSQALVDQAARLYARCQAISLASEPGQQQLAPLLLAPALSSMAPSAVELCRGYGIPAETLVYLYGRQAGRQADVERCLVALLETTGLLYGLLRRTVPGSDYSRGALCRQAALGVWEALCALARLFVLDPEAWLAGSGEGTEEGHAPSLSLVDILSAPDLSWPAGASALLCAGFPGRTALLFVPASPSPWRQDDGALGWYALGAEEIGWALSQGLVVTSRDGWCRGFRVLDAGATRLGLSLKEARMRVSSGHPLPCPV